MAIDNTPPRLKLIATLAVIVIVTLVALNFVFTSYYGYMTDEATREKLAPTTEKYEQQKTEKEALAAANIDKAMAGLKATRAASIVPEQSMDMAAMQGWNKLPKPVPAMPKPAGEMAMGDAGVGSSAMATDGGAPKAEGDAGAAKPPTH